MEQLSGARVLRMTPGDALDRDASPVVGVGSARRATCHAKLLCLASVFFAATIAANAAADSAARRGTVSLAFATVREGREILTQRDDFVQRLSPFDRSSRLKSGSDVSEEAYLQFVAENVRAWTADKKALVESALASIRSRLDALSLPWPTEIYVITTTGREEGGASYTRGNAIVLPSAVLLEESRSPGGLRRIIAHELFHILSRNNPGLKEKLYAVVGFHPCGEIAFPTGLAAVKITNPDAPRNDHCIRVKVADSSTWAMPILFSRAARYDVLKDGEFFTYLQLRFLLLDGGDSQAPRSVSFDDRQPRLVSLSDVTGFFEQVGRNTDYVIHPEEILADNFALLVVEAGRVVVASPEVITRLRRVLQEARVS
ncbi:MAG TPA: hypothetical protein VG429_06100 [Casimicrobiaceae bacterium]|nr:hypothetical protein [Casimicrobiaceae bacterium]